MDREGSPPSEPAGGDVSEERTLGDAGWPVDDHYFVEPDPQDLQAEVERIGPDEAGEVAPAALAAGRSRAAVLGVGLLALALLLAAAAGAWILLRPAHAGNASGASRPPPSSRTGAPTTSSSSSTTSTTTSTSTTTTPAPRTTVAVPDANGLTLSGAKSRLSNVGLRVRVRSERSDAPRGKVVRQAPGPGGRLRRNALVVLTVSSGPASAGVPLLVGLRADSAAKKTRALGLVPELRLVRSTRSAGTVLAQHPASGARVSRGGTVTLDVAKNVAKPARVVTRVRVPSVGGLSLSAARLRLAGAGLHAASTRIDSNRPEGTVVDQSPAAGARVRKGTTVQLRVSSGPAQVTVPSVVGLDQQSAQAELEASGFQVRVENEPTADPTQDGMVASQDPEAGAKAADGSTVTITVDQLG